MVSDLAGAVEGFVDEMIDSRRTLHASPELSFEEHATTALVRDRLRALKLTELPAETPTGALFEVEGGKPGRTVLLRAGIDALPIQEETGLAFASTVDGVMHACGHDGHTAMLLGVASALAARAEDLAGRYIFLWQPAEEKLAGARAMIEAGVLDRTEPDWVLGCHLSAWNPVGTILARPGIALSDGQGLRFSLRGAGGHGAFGIVKGDVVLAVGELVGRLHQTVDGLEHEGTRCACSAGVLRAGEASNVVPRTALVEATLRTFTAEQKQDALTRLGALIDQVAEAFDVEIDLELTLHAWPTDNDPNATAVVRLAATRTLGRQAVVDAPPPPASDDVSEFLRRVPGCYFFVGAAPPTGPTMHHAATFRIDESALPAGALVLAQSALGLATSPGHR